ncbi:MULTISPECIES: tail fiber domain-containing protein [Niastella]|uniref:Tail fiber domain-containing protein n=1 Tax=Niastella soli TaxID=2821487 RepID=A0ABS3YU37_9BACT|nr:tail fiber domain-containing protein [Niastella soli]MBO9201397.1 tail fiber domain-containing protein [Niastella soli]
MKPYAPLTWSVLLFSLFCISIPGTAQSVAINTDGSTANASAILDVKSDTKGLLIPRLTTVQRTAITSPATGLLVFDTDTNTFWFFDGTIWKKMDAAGNDWSITGNSGTTAATRFIGTTDAVDLVLKTNNTERMRWLYTANTKNIIATISTGDLSVNGVYIGRGPGNITSNTVAGVQALFYNTTGTNNTGVGYVTLSNNTSGSSNTAVGYSSLYINSTGNRNTAIGRSALYNSNTGTGNTGVGSYALFYNTGGNNNTGIGDDAIGSNTTGNSNAAVGQQSMYDNTTGSFNAASGVSALFSNTSGSYNTAMGSEALGANTIGNNNTGVGYNADVSQGDLTNATAIGAGTTVNASNKVLIGNSSVTVIGGQVGWSILSDGRFKTNIKEDVPGLDFIMQLRPVNYNFMARKYEDHVMKNMPDSIKNKPGRKAVSYSAAEQVLHTGFIAQEVEQVVKKNGYHFNGVHIPTSETDNYSITYDEFVVPLVKAMQQLNSKVEKLTTENELLKKQLDDINKRLNKLEAH